MCWRATAVCEEVNLGDVKLDANSWLCAAELSLPPEREKSLCQEKNPSFPPSSPSLLASFMTKAVPFTSPPPPLSLTSFFALRSCAESAHPCRELQCSLGVGAVPLLPACSAHSHLLASSEPLLHLLQAAVCVRRAWHSRGVRVTALHRSGDADVLSLSLTSCQGGSHPKRCYSQSDPFLKLFTGMMSAYLVQGCWCRHGDRDHSEIALTIQQTSS